MPVSILLLSRQSVEKKIVDKFGELHYFSFSFVRIRLSNRKINEMFRIRNFERARLSTERKLNKLGIRLNGIFFRE